MAAVEKLAPLRHPLTEDPLASWTMPARWYTDPEVFQREKTAIFYRTWHYVGHASELARPGDYVTGMVADQRVMVVRGRDGVLRGFHNTCMHRGHHILAGKGNVTRDFTVSFSGTPSSTGATLALVPRAPDADYARMLLTVDLPGLRILGLTTVDLQGGTSAFTFTRLKENQGLTDKQFAFRIPKGVDVLTDDGAR